jgi:hypothetical protein
MAKLKPKALLAQSKVKKGPSQISENATPNRAERFF